MLLQPPALVTRSAPKEFPDSQVIWIAWERHRRTIELCHFLGISPTIFESDRPRWIRHPWMALRTIALLLRQQPKILIVQNPSLLLAVIASLLKTVLHYKLVVDAHNTGVRPEGWVLQRLGFLAHFVQRAADVTVVTNQYLAEDVRANSGRPFVMPDLIPTSPTGRMVPLPGKRRVLLICTFSEDEPYTAFFEAVRNLPVDYRVYITGNVNRAIPGTLDNLPDNVILTGFLPESDYWTLLRSVDIVVDLTRREDCLVCGAYEAVAVGKPMVLSDSKVLREYFSCGVVHTRNCATAIQNSIFRAFEDLDELRAQVVSLCTQRKREWARIGEAFRTLIYQDIQSPSDPRSQPGPAADIELPKQS